jgi:hypothetical protein
MANFDDVRRKFSNHRQWRDFVAAIHESVAYPNSVPACPVTYPMVLNALRAGRAWFNDGAVRASSWLSPRSGIQRQTLGV